MRTQQAGFTMIEVLVTIGILVVGLLGLAALQALTTVSELEAYQRSQAIVLVRDMADRMNGNKPNLNSYVANDVGLSAANCASLTGAALDLCEWGNELNGASEKAGSANVGAMIGARGCVVKIDPTNYLVTVAWQGVARGGAEPQEACGSGAYGAPGLRRTVSTVVTLALLAAP